MGPDCPQIVIFRNNIFGMVKVIYGTLLEII